MELLQTKAPNEPNMRRLPDIVVHDAIAFTDETGRITEIQVNGDHAGYEEAQTWILMHVPPDAELRFHQAPAEDPDEICTLSDYAVEAGELFRQVWPEGLETITVGRHHRTPGAEQEVVMRGTRRALKAFYSDNWGGGFESEAEAFARITPVETEEASA